MAKKRQTLDFIDIVMGADADVIKQAYEARVKIDDQLALREEAYRRIAELETKVEEIIGSPGEFLFPAPPVPVAGYSKLIPASRPAPKPTRPAEAKTEQPEVEKKQEAEKKPEVAPEKEKTAEEAKSTKSGKSGK